MSINLLRSKIKKKSRAGHHEKKATPTPTVPPKPLVASGTSGGGGGVAGGGGGKSTGQVTLLGLLAKDGIVKRKPNSVSSPPEIHSPIHQQVSNKYYGEAIMFLEYPWLYKGP